MFAGVYLTLSMALTSLSVIFTVWVLKLHHNGVYQVPVPPSLRRFVLGRLARFVCPKSFTSNTKVKALKRRMRETSDEHSQRLAGAHVAEAELKVDAFARRAFEVIIEANAVPLKQSSKGTPFL